MTTTLLSHPDQTLLKHIQGVLSAAKALSQQRKFSEWEDQTFRDLVSIACVFHDFAKSTSYFQEYIRTLEKRKTVLSRHSLLSSIVGYQLAKWMFKHREVPHLPDAFFLLMAIKRHHGDVKDFMAELSDYLYETEHLMQQARAVHFQAWNELIYELLRDLPAEIQRLFPLTEQQLTTWISDLKKDVFEMRTWLRKQKKEATLQGYFRFCNLYSILLDADKNQAALRDRFNMNRKEINADIARDFKQAQSWDSSSLNEWRNRAFQEVEQNIHTTDGRIFSLHLPTGMGKTLISFHAALQLRERRKQETGLAPQIIYALPFLSVIDQNFALFENVLKSHGHHLDHSILLKHHSLIEPTYQKDQESEFDIGESKLLIEGWNSEIVCTTFVQLFQTLLSNRNRTLRRFHRLSHAIILIDEIQAVPVKYWTLIRELLLELSTQSDIIILTATEPKIFEPGDPIKKLCDPKPYFQAVNRVKLISEVQSKQTIEELILSLQLQDDLSYLFIFNTIGSAKSAYNLIRKLVDEPIGFLSTHLPPKERLHRIQQIKRGKYRIVVSTQLVEAGVDISFDCVFRDLAPLDSIIQSAGRCNRNGNRSGEVHVLCLWDGQKRYASYIYEPVKLDITQHLLSRRLEWNEPDLFSLTDDYFQLIKLRAKNESTCFLEGLKSFYFDGEANSTKKPVSAFQLIEETYEKIDVFIEIDEEAKDVWKSFVQIMYIDDPLTRHQAYLGIKKAFQDYVISVPYQTNNRPPCLFDTFYHVSHADLSTYYDLQTGFRTEGVNPIW